MPGIRHLAALMLLLLSGLPLTYGLLWAPVLGSALSADPTVIFPLGPARGGVLGLLFTALALLASLLTAIAALGAAIGRRLWWWLAVIVACGWLLTICFPVALLALGILVLPDVRARAFSQRDRRR